MHTMNRSSNGRFVEDFQVISSASIIINDQMCQDYLTDKLGQRGLEHYKALLIAEHRAFFLHVCCYFSREEFTWT